MTNDFNKYITLIFIIFTSILFTIIIGLSLDPIAQYISPNYKNCYTVLKNISEVKNKIFYIEVFYIILFISYFLLLSLLLIKVLKIKLIKNVYITTTILIIFNAFLMFKYMYADIGLKKISIDLCELTKDGCSSSYKFINHIDYNQTINIPIEKIKQCLENPLKYYDKFKINTD
jgi:hypothetical protein